MLALLLGEVYLAYVEFLERFLVASVSGAQLPFVEMLGMKFIMFWDTFLQSSLFYLKST